MGDVVFTNGCFDVLHVGHVRLLQFARHEGAKLIVGVNSDASIRRLKGEGRPIVPDYERREVLMALRCVDSVIIFAEDTPERLIRELRPDVLVKGPDYREQPVVGREIVESLGGRVVIPDWPVTHCTTRIIERIRAL